MLCGGGQLQSACRIRYVARISLYLLKAGINSKDNKANAEVKGQTPVFSGDQFADGWEARGCSFLSRL